MFYLYVGNVWNVLKLLRWDWFHVVRFEVEHLSEKSLLLFWYFVGWAHCCFYVQIFWVQPCLCVRHFIVKRFRLINGDKTRKTQAYLASGILMPIFQPPNPPYDNGAAFLKIKCLFFSKNVLHQRHISSTVWFWASKPFTIAYLRRRWAKCKINFMEKSHDIKWWWWTGFCK